MQAWQTVQVVTQKCGYPVVPGTTIALFSRPEKMPGYSWSIPAVQTCPGRVITPDVNGNQAICGICYADTNSLKADGKHKRYSRYGNPHVQRALQARWQWTLDSLVTESGRDEWVNYMTAALYKVSRWSKKEFRIHDSGDFFNPQYATMWQRVIANLPDVSFWAPTRSYRIKRILPVLQNIATLPNAAIRPSALHVDGPLPVIPGLHAGSGASHGEYTCPASDQGGKCQTCRTCWFDKTREVLYHTH